MHPDIETQRAVTWATPSGGTVRVHYHALSETFRVVIDDAHAAERPYFSLAHLIRDFGAPAAERAVALRTLRLSATFPAHFPLEELPPCRG